MSKLSKELHMFVADQWIQGNAETPRVAKAACSHWFPGGVTEVAVGSKYKYFQGVTPAEVTQMLQGAGWYSWVAKEAKQVLHDATVDTVYMEYSNARPDSIFIAVQGPVRVHTGYLEYKKGHSPALFLLAAYRALKKRKEAEKHSVINAIRTGTPLRGHTSRMQGPDINVQTIPKPQKLNTLLLHRDLANALEAVNRVLHWGCNERQPPYQETGWKDVPLDKYKQALLRHQSEWLKDPSSLDEESGKLHLAHMATNALILLQRWPEEGKNGSTDH